MKKKRSITLHIVNGGIGSNLKRSTQKLKLLNLKHTGTRAVIGYMRNR
ncbi:MAG: hypothetical protein GYA75_08825 [Bacteroidales bacterium]|mgnify:CR=1 FL=1|jgi:hypothetical protein|nr:hypothetical protein [Bacteroidales bacterium]